MTLRDDITQAVGEAQVEGFSFVRLTQWESILDQIAERFLKRGGRDLESVWIWNEFREVVSSTQPANPIGYLRGQIESAADYWFIASDEHGKYWIADATGEAIVRTIEEMYCFEYYVVDRHLDWILCENHHGIFIKARSAKTPSGEQGIAADRQPLCKSASTAPP